MSKNLKQVVIIGGGFGGLSVAKKITNPELNIVIIDKTNHHLFQPLLYQVATAALSPADIAVPIRAIFSKNKKIKVLMDEAISIDKINKKVILRSCTIDFDYLVIATGTHHSYFGNEGWAEHAQCLKTLSDALAIREKIINSLELAERENDEKKKLKYLSFIVVGGGPTGVELAGAIAEIAKKTIFKDYKNFHPDDTKVILIESLPRILISFSESLSEKAANDLKKMGVEVKVDTKVENITEDKVYLSDNIIESSNIIWAAGNTASSLIKTLDTKMDINGRAVVENDCSIAGYENIFVIGDASQMFDENGKQLPAIAPVAMQQGRFVGKIISNEISKEERNGFHYVDKGSMATIGKAKAVAEIKGFKFSGYPAWVLWSFIHIFFLISFRNRFRVMAEWILYYITNKRGTRLIVGK